MGSNWRVTCGLKVEHCVCVLLVVLQERKRNQTWGNGGHLQKQSWKTRGNGMLVYKWMAG